MLPCLFPSHSTSGSNFIPDPTTDSTMITDPTFDSTMIADSIWLHHYCRSHIWLYYDRRFHLCLHHYRRSHPRLQHYAQIQTLTPRVLQIPPLTPSLSQIPPLTPPLSHILPLTPPLSQIQPLTPPIYKLYNFPYRNPTICGIPVITERGSRSRIGKQKWRTRSILCLPKAWSCVELYGCRWRLLWLILTGVFWVVQLARKTDWKLFTNHRSFRYCYAIGRWAGAVEWCRVAILDYLNPELDYLRCICM